MQCVPLRLGLSQPVVYMHRLLTPTGAYSHGCRLRILPATRCSYMCMPGVLCFCLPIYEYLLILLCTCPFLSSRPWHLPSRASICCVFDCVGNRRYLASLFFLFLFSSSSNCQQNGPLFTSTSSQLSSSPLRRPLRRPLDTSRPPGTVIVSDSPNLPIHLESSDWKGARSFFQRTRIRSTWPGVNL